MRGLQHQLVLVDHRLQAVGLLIDKVGEIGRRFRKLLLRELSAYLDLDLGPNAFKAALLATALVGQADDVISEIGFDHPAGFTDLQSVGHVLEGLDHRTATEEVEVATIDCRSRVLRVFPGQLGEVLRMLRDFHQQSLGLGFRLGAFGSR